MASMSRFMLPVSMQQRRLRPCFCLTRNNPNYANLLEEYTRRRRSEVLLVHTIIDEDEDVEEEDREDVVLVYKGFCSSLLKATSLDPAEDVLRGSIQRIDRVRAPYEPNNVQYIEQGLDWQHFEQYLEEQDV